MKVTGDKLFACEQERASRERQARQLWSQEYQEEAAAMSAGETLFWRAFYVLVHVAAIVLVIATLYKFWSKS